MRQRLRSEDGFSIVIAVILLGFMLSAGLASYAYVDTEQNQSRVERVDESALNLGEGVLNTQAFILSRHWPRTAARAYPATCTETSAPTTFCPQPSAMASVFDSTDYSTGKPTWEIKVRDDNGSNFYDEAALEGEERYDANRNDRIWVRAQAKFTVGPHKGRVRAVVAQIQIERVPVGVQFPERTVIASKFSISNSGNQEYVWTNPTQTSPHPVTLRCKPVTSTACADYKRDLNIQPPGAIETGYVGQPAISPQMQAALKETAMTDGTYYTNTCPTSYTGAVVWIESATLCTIDEKDKVVNSLSAPGVVIAGSGKLELSANTTFYGVLYAINSLNRTDWDMIRIHANANLVGRLFVDGAGGVTIGSSKDNLDYEDFKNATSPLGVYGTAGVVQNSWREVAVDEDDLD